LKKENSFSLKVDQVVELGIHVGWVENVIKLIYESLLNIKDGDSFSYFD
jgi:hypothetical protein